MKWLPSFRRKIHAPPGEPVPAGELGLPLPLVPELYQAVARMALSCGVEPAVLANDLLCEAIAHRRLVESVKGRWPALTHRERQVARLAAQGLSNARIGDQLCISPETVRSHVANVLHRLGLERRAQLREALEAIDREEQG